MPSVSSSDSPPVSSTATDAVLWQRFSGERSPEAFAEIVARYHGLVHGTAHRILNDADAARDVVQNVFVRLARGVRMIRPEALPAWLHRVSRHEALNTQRSEIRRRRREQTMSAHLHPGHSSPAAPELPDHWADAREHLDAALDSLSRGERQCVLQRYLQGKALREIADASGKSEDAARMTIHRALGKMSGFLRRRGVVLSSTALAAGLGAEFTRAAVPLSASAASALSTDILTKSTAVSAGSTTLTFFSSLVMTKTTVITGAAALVFLLSLGGGWLANRKKTPGSAPAPTPEIVAPNSPAKSTASAPDNAIAKPAPAQTKVDEIIAKLEALRRKRMAISNRIPRDGDTVPDPATVESVFRDIEALEPELKAVLSELDAASIPAAIAAALQFGDPARGILLGHLFVRWGELDPRRAMAEVENLPVSLRDTGRVSTARGWAHRDPKVALAAAADVHPDDNEKRTRFVREVITGWMQSDAGAAVQAIADLPVDDQRHAAKAFDDLSRYPSQRAAATAAIAKLTDDSLRADIAGAVTEDWAKFDGPAAAAWFDALPWGNSNAGLKAACELVEEWGRTPQSMGPALDWLWPKVPLLMQPEVLEEIVAEKWARLDKAGAEAWLAKHSIPVSAVPDWERHTRAK